MLSLKRRASNGFSVEVRLEGGQVVPAAPAEFTVVHGVSIGDPPLARSIGVARADNHVSVYFERGVPLPCRKTFTHRTVHNIAPSATDFALRVPIVQGDFPFAHLCRLVGVIQIPAAALQRTLPAGSVVELTLEVDRGGALSARAHIPAQDLVFEHIEHLVAPDASLDDMLLLLTEQRQRAASLRAGAFRAGDKRTLGLLADFDSLIESATRELDAARGGEQDAVEKARRALIDSDGLLGDAEAASAWPDLSARVNDEHLDAAFWVQQFGTEAERSGLGRSVQAVERAMRAKNLGDVERQLTSMQRLRVTCYLRSPGAWQELLDEAASRLDETSDPRRARALLEQGRSAEAKGDSSGVERAVRDIWALLPPEQSVRKLGFDSGVT
jgi:molecular chaperone DnaK